MQAMVDSSERRWVVLRTSVLGTAVISLSAGLIHFNKYLMVDGHFPYAVPLVLSHMGFCSVFAFLLFKVCPWLFPALTDPLKQISVDAKFVLTSLVPIATLFGGGLVLSNVAYTDLSVAFAQMIKQTGIVLVFLLSVPFGLDSFSWVKSQLVVLTCLCCLMNITGELNFHWAGFIIQVSAVLCDAFRILVQAHALAEHKLDALSYVLLVSPLCFLITGAAMCVIWCLPASVATDGWMLPPIATLWQWAPILLLSCFVAFGLNVSIALLIKYTSPTTYTMCHVLKDVVAVAFAVTVVREAVSLHQAVFFTCQALCIFTWSLLRLFPEKFEDGLITGVHRILCEPDALAKDVGATAGSRLLAQQAVEASQLAKV